MTAPITEAEVAAIVKGLTKAQADAVVTCGPMWRRTTGSGKGVYKSAALRSLVDGEWTFNHARSRYRQRVRLTPLGLAVRAHLIRDLKGPRA